MHKFAVNRGKIVLSSEITTNQTTHDNPLPSTTQIHLPPQSSPLKINLSFLIDKILICESNTPNIHNWLFALLSNSKIWSHLQYTESFTKLPSSFTISLTDTLFDENIFTDIINSKFEQEKLNSVNIETISEISIRININSISDLDNLLPDLNYILFQTFIKLESKYPLIFNYISRKSYQSSISSIPFIVSTFHKSEETQLSYQRSFIIGLFKSLNNSPSYIDHISNSHYSTVKRSLENKDSFTLSWFVLDSSLPTKI